MATTNLSEESNKSIIINSNTPKSNSVCVVKDIPFGTDIAMLKEIFEVFGEIIGIYIFEAKSYAYIHYTSSESVQKAISALLQNPPTVLGKYITILPIIHSESKNKPLDLNEPSTILLMTFYNLVKQIKVSDLLELFSSFGVINKIILYQKKNIHALIEMDTLEMAMRVKESMDGKTIKNFFRLRVQYTAKKELVIHPNTPNEYSRYAACKPPPDSTHQNTFSFLNLSPKLPYPDANAQINLPYHHSYNPAVQKMQHFQGHNGQLEMLQFQNSISNSQIQIMGQPSKKQVYSDRYYQKVNQISENFQVPFQQTQMYSDPFCSFKSMNSLSEGYSKYPSNSNKMNFNTKMSPGKYKFPMYPSIEKRPSIEKYSNQRHENYNQQKEDVFLSIKAKTVSDINDFAQKSSDKNNDIASFKNETMSCCNEKEFEKNSQSKMSNISTSDKLPSFGSNEDFFENQKKFYSQQEPSKSVLTNSEIIDHFNSGEKLNQKDVIPFLSNENELLGDESKKLLNRNMLYIDNLPGGAVNLDMLFNLFSVYGNICMIRFCSKSKESALIEYQDQYQAMIAKMNLDNCPIFGFHIKVMLSQIDINLLNQQNNPPELYKDFSLFKEQRFKIPGSKNFKNLSSPSKHLHLSNIHPRADELCLQNLFKSIATPLKITFFDNNKSMAAITFDSIDQAVRILMTFHNFNLDTRLLKVSFLKNNAKQQLV